MSEVTYELRKLQSSDIFLMVKIINKIGAQKFKSAIESTGVLEAIGDENANEVTIGISVAIEIAMIVLEHLPDAEDEIYGFLSNLSGLKCKELQAIEPADFAEMIIAVFEKQEFKDFIKVASRFVK